MINPYVDWLGLDPKVVEPNLFELIGLKTDVSDAEQIRTAADRALARVRRCRPGEHAKKWAGLLDELEEAKRVLSDALLRAEYLNRISTTERFPPATRSVEKRKQSTKKTPELDSPAPRASDAPKRPASSKDSVAPSKAPAPRASSHSPKPTTPSTQQAGDSRRSNSIAPSATTNPATSKGSIEPSGESPKESSAPVLRKATSPSNSDNVVSESDPKRSSPVDPVDPDDPMAPVAITSLPKSADGAVQTDVGLAPITAAPLAKSQSDEIEESQPSAQSSPTMETERLIADDDPMAPVMIPVDSAGSNNDAVPLEAAEQPMSNPMATGKSVSDEPVLIASDRIGGRRGRRSTWIAVIGLVGVFGAVTLVAAWQLPGLLGSSNDSDQVADASTDGQGSESNNEGDSNRRADDQSSNNNDSNNDDSNRGQSGDDSDTNQDQTDDDGNSGVVNEDSTSNNDQTSNNDLASSDNDQTNMTDVDNADSDGNSVDSNSVDNNDQVATNDDNAADNDMDNDGNQTITDAPEIADVIAFGEGLADVQQLLYERKVDEALSRLDEIRTTIPHRLEDQLLADRLATIADLIQTFWTSVEQGASTLQGGEELRYSETTVVLVVEVQPELLIYRFEGTSFRVHPRELRPGLAILVAEKGLPESAIESRIIKGAFYAIERINKPSLRDRATSLWEEAELMGGDVESLLAYLDDDYDLSMTMIEQGPTPLASDIDDARTLVVD